MKFIKHLFSGIVLQGIGLSLFAQTDKPNIVVIMTVVKENESLDSALRRFKRNCAKAGIQQEIRKREHYEKPSVRRKKKSEAARKRKYN